MTDRAKLVSRPWQPQDLIDDLQSIIDEEPDNYLNTRRTTLRMAMDYLKEHFEEQKWIPVTERLPEEDVRVIVHLKSEIYGHSHMDTDRLHRGKFVRWEGRVTHWMPLPEPPKEDTHG